MLCSLVRPRYFVPVHGEYRHLAQHSAIAERVIAGLEARRSTSCWPRTATSCASTPTAPAVVGKAPTGRVLIDDTRVGEVADEVLRDRRHLADDGIVLPVVALRTAERRARGRARDRHARRGDARRRAATLSASTRAAADATSSAHCAWRSAPTPGLLREAIRVELRRFFRTTVRPPPAGAAGRHGNLETLTVERLRRLSRTDQRVRRRRPLRALRSSGSSRSSTYEPTDPVWFFTAGDAHPPANFVGLVGAFVAEAVVPAARLQPRSSSRRSRRAGWNFFWCRTVGRRPTPESVRRHAVRRLPGGACSASSLGSAERGRRDRSAPAATIGRVASASALAAPTSIGPARSS